MTFGEFLISNAGPFFGFLGAALAAGGQSGGDGQQQEQTDSALNDVLHDFLHSPAPIAGRFSTLIHYHTTEIK